MPMLKPNQQMVDAAKPKGGRTDYAIEGFPGLVLLVSAAGEATWTLRVQIGKGRNAPRPEAV